MLIFGTLWRPSTKQRRGNKRPPRGNSKDWGAPSTRKFVYKVYGKFMYEVRGKFVYKVHEKFLYKVYGKFVYKLYGKFVNKVYGKFVYKVYGKFVYKVYGKFVNKVHGKYLYKVNIGNLITRCRVQIKGNKGGKTKECSIRMHF